MKLSFPPGFFWGTSTAAAQIESAYDHQWKGLKSQDGYVLDRTTDHELRRDEDAAIIAQFGSVYRCSVDWSRLQTEPYGEFHLEVVEEYQVFFNDLNERGMKIMFVIYHFAHPRWLEALGGWTKEKNISYFVDFATRCITHFGQYAWIWNTINEPNVYASLSYQSGEFPPHKKNVALADRVLRHLSKAHKVVYHHIKEKYPEARVGISLNTIWFTGTGLPGKIMASLADWWFNRRAAKLFAQVDFLGISYYAHIIYDPRMISMGSHPEVIKKKNLSHDDMWIYYPEGMGFILRRLYKKYKKPIIITENGICTADPKRRIESIKDYLAVLHQLIQDGIPILGYIHWSTWDNFEWNKGPTFQFGLVSVDRNTMERHMTEAGLFYQKIAQNNEVSL